MTTDQEMGAMLDVEHEGLNDAVRAFVSTVVKERGTLAPTCFIRATRNPKSGEELPEPVLAAVSIEGNYSAPDKKAMISHTVRTVASKAAAKWVVFLLPGILNFEGKESEIVLCTTEHDGGEFQFAAFVERVTFPRVVGFRDIKWEKSQDWIRGMLEGARERRLDLS